MEKNWRSSRKLSDRHIQELARRTITLDLALEAGIFSVDSIEGAETLGFTPTARRDTSGMIIPNFRPESPHPRSYRLRLDTPELRRRGDKLIPKNRYLGEPTTPPHLYFVPGTKKEWLADKSIRAILIEGELKTLGLWRLLRSHQEEGKPRFVTIGFPGANSWSGPVEKITNEYGARVTVRGLLNDFELIEFDGREVIIFRDSNIHINRSVQGAIRELTNELQLLGARVFYSDTPDLPGVNGADDWAYLYGDEPVLEAIFNARSAIITPRKKGLTDIQERALKREALRDVVELAKEKAGLLSARGINTEREISQCIDVVNFALVRMKCPKAARPFFYAGIGMVHEQTSPGAEVLQFEATDYDLGKRIPGKHTKSAIKGRGKYARRAAERWMKESGYLCVEMVGGGQEYKKNVKSLYRFRLLEALAIAVEIARERPEDKKAFQKEAKRAIEMIKGEFVKRSRCAQAPKGLSAKLSRNAATVKTLNDTNLEIIAQLVEEGIRGGLDAVEGAEVIVSQARAYVAKITSRLNDKLQQIIKDAERVKANPACSSETILSIWKERGHKTTRNQQETKLEGEDKFLSPVNRVYLKQREEIGAENAKRAG